MSWWETLRTGLDTLRSHRLRSGLTMLGILIGIAAVILTVGLGEGAQAQISSRINALGTNLLVVTPGSSTAGGVRGGAGSASTLTVSDAAALASRVVAPDIAAVAATSQRSETLAAAGANWTTTVVGTTPAWLGVRARQLAEGRFLSDADVSSDASVTVLGASTAQQLFAGDPVGQAVTVNGLPMTVVGVLASSGAAGGTNQDDMALIPLSTAQQRLFGGASRLSVQAIYIEAVSQDSLSAAYQEANAELSSLHRATTAAGGADFSIASQESLLSTATSVTRTLTVLLAGIAGISLIVGGIGVMNIMLVSVTERVREIGLRKALGAPPRVIRRQFLVESSMLGLVGGLVGTVLGLVGAWSLPSVIGQPITASPAAAAVSITVAVVVGIVSGVYPATRAARLAPIDALRSE